MKVEELVKEYETGKKRKTEYSFKKHIVMEYMSYSEKLSFVKNIVKTSSYVEVDGKTLYKRNTANMLFLFSLGLIQRYTDIEIDNDKVVAEYDALVASGAMDGILSAIPDEEINIIKGLLDMERDDLEANTRSLVSFLETKFDSAEIAINSLLEVLDSPEIKEKIIELKNADK